MTLTLGHFLTLGAMLFALGCGVRRQIAEAASARIAPACPVGEQDQ